MALLLSPEHTVGREQSPGSEAVSVVHRRIHVAGAIVDYEVRKPDRVTDPVADLHLTGYLGIPSSYREYLDSLVGRNRISVLLYSPRLQRGRTFVPANLLHPERLQAQAAWSVIKDLRDNDDAERVDLTGHSKGGVDVVNAGNYIARHRDPDAVRSVNIHLGAGAVDASLADLRHRARVMVLDEIVPNMGDIVHRLGWRTATEMMHYLPHVRTITEGIAVTQADIRPRLEGLMDSGVPVHGIYGENDPLFPPEEVYNRIGPLVTSFTTINTGHLAHQLHPELTAEAHDSILR